MLGGGEEGGERVRMTRETARMGMGMRMEKGYGGGGGGGVGERGVGGGGGSRPLNWLIGWAEWTLGDGGRRICSLFLFSS